MTSAAEKAFNTTANAQAVPCEAPSGTEKCPVGTIRIGVFFDGTNNNAHRDWPPSRKTGKLPKNASNAPTNVIKLYELFRNDGAVQKRVYHHGVGSGSKDTKAGESTPVSTFFGGMFGGGGANRVYWGLDMVTDFFNLGKNHLAKEKCIDVYGFSRGAAIARDFINTVREAGVDNKQKPDGFKEIYTGPDTPPVLVPKYDRFRDVVFEFLGVFDTVASFGLGGASIGNKIAQYNFFVDGTTPGNSVLKTAHFIAEDEIRMNFPLESIDQEPAAAAKDPLPKHMIERPYPGAHSDVGGGYKFVPKVPAVPPTKPWYLLGLYEIEGTPEVPAKHPELAHIPLRDMHKESTTNGGRVPLKPVTSLPENLRKVPADLEKAYGQYIKDRPGLAVKGSGALGDKYLQGLPKDQYRPLYFETRQALPSWQTLNVKYIHDSRWPQDKIVSQKQRTVHYMAPQKKK